MNERGREKFFLRMLDGADECRKFSGQKPNRGIEEVCEELCRIRELCSGVKGKLNWDKSYISEKDLSLIHIWSRWNVVLFSRLPETGQGIV